MIHSGLSSDQEFIEALKQGRKDVLGDFYTAGKEAFMQWAKSHFPLGEEDVTDVYQDAVVLLFENVVSGRYVAGGSSVKTYLYAIAKHLFYRKIQQAKRHADKMQEVYDYYFDTSFDVEEERKIHAAQQAFAAMTEPCKSILSLFYYQKLSMAHIAERLGYKSDTVVKSQKVRCLKTLRNETIKILGSNDR